MKKQRVLVAMSGGVDSSVAAARLLQQGFDVVGVTLHLWDYPEDGSAKSRCCAPEDVHDARRVADLLGFPHYAFDRRELFRSEVVDPFVDSYLAGETPSPCVRCNRGVKLKELAQLAERLEADRIATGHYARNVRRNGRNELHRARDRAKDQSYFLHTVAEGVLEKLVFPLGDAEKSEVRDEARRLGLPGANKGESQELCFVPAGRYDAFVEQRADGRLRPGPIVDAAGKVVGRHNGIHAFTLGQRRNLGVALGERAYVTGVDPESATVRLGRKEDLMAFAAIVDDVRLFADFMLPGAADVVVRYHGKAVPSAIERLSEHKVSVRFSTPIQAVVPGQFAVFYDGERVLGGGSIRQALGSGESPS